MCGFDAECAELLQFMLLFWHIAHHRVHALSRCSTRSSLENHTLHTVTAQRHNPSYYRERARHPSASERAEPPTPRCPSTGQDRKLSLPFTRSTGPTNLPLASVQEGGNLLSLGSAEAHTAQTVGSETGQPWRRNPWPTVSFDVTRRIASMRLEPIDGPKVLEL